MCQAAVLFLQERYSQASDIYEELAQNHPFVISFTLIHFTVIFLIIHIYASPVSILLCMSMLQPAN